MRRGDQTLTTGPEAYIWRGDQTHGIVILLATTRPYNTLPDMFNLVSRSNCVTLTESANQAGIIAFEELLPYLQQVFSMSLSTSSKPFISCQLCGPTLSSGSLIYIYIYIRCLYTTDCNATTPNDSIRSPHSFLLIRPHAPLWAQRDSQTRFDLQSMRPTPSWAHHWLQTPLERPNPARKQHEISERVIKSVTTSGVENMWYHTSSTCTLTTAKGPLLYARTTTHYPPGPIPLTPTL